MIVAVVRRPTECAVSMTSSHSSVEILSAQMRWRISSSRISAAVPGSVASPAAFSCSRYVRSGMPMVFAPCQISSGEKAWMWISGTASLAARQMLRYVSPV